MNMTKFRYFEYQNFARSGLNRFYLISLKKLNIRTNWPCFGYFGTRVYQYRKYERNQFFGCVRDFDDHIWFLLTLTLKDSKCKWECHLKVKWFTFIIEQVPTIKVSYVWQYSMWKNWPTFQGEMSNPEGMPFAKFRSRCLFTRKIRFVGRSLKK